MGNIVASIKCLDFRIINLTYGGFFMFYNHYYRSNLDIQHTWHAIAIGESSQLAPKPSRPNQIQPTRPNTGSPQYRLAPVVLPVSRSVTSTDHADRGNFNPEQNMSSHFASENRGLAPVLEAHAAVHVHVLDF